MDSPNWIKMKKVAINPINQKYNKCFQYIVVVVLNHEEIGKYNKRITKIKVFINKYNWEEIHYPSGKDDWKEIQKNNLAIALNVLYAKNQKIYPAYDSKQNSKREKQAFFNVFKRKRMALYCSNKVD